MLMKQNLSAHQKQMRFLTVMFITTAIALFAVIYWISIKNL
jgi:hypothetical protein